MIVRHRRPALDFDRAFEQLTNSFFDSTRQRGPAVEGAWDEGEYVLTVDLPGVPADAVSVEVSGDLLTLGATTDRLEWQRSMRLGGRLDPDRIVANHVDGRLTVRIGTYAEPEARRIEIGTAPEAAAIETTSDDSSES